MAVQNPYYPVNTDLGAVVTLAAAAAGGNSSTYTTSGATGLRANINISAISGTSATLTVTVQGYDTASGTYYTLLQSAGLQATGFTQLVVRIGVTAATNLAINLPAPAHFRILYTITGTTPSVTGTVGVELLA